MPLLAAQLSEPDGVNCALTAWEPTGRAAVLKEALALGEIPLGGTTGIAPEVSGPIVNVIVPDGASPELQPIELTDALKVAMAPTFVGLTAD